MEDTTQGQTTVRSWASGVCRFTHKNEAITLMTEDSHGSLNECRHAGNRNGIGNVGSGNGNGNGNGNAGGKGDPILTGFDGRSFEFKGEVGQYYDILSERSHLVRCVPFFLSPLYRVVQRLTSVCRRAICKSIKDA